MMRSDFNPSASATTVVKGSVSSVTSTAAPPSPGRSEKVRSLSTTGGYMGIKASPGAVKAGEITFNVTNDSKDTVHEMIVMYLANPGKPLPYLEAENRVDEDKAGDKGEVSELDPGKSGTLTVELKAGKYLLICNVPGHYGAGMWAEFTVEP